MAAGLSADPIAAPSGSAIAGVTRDASSGIYCPASAGEWTLLMAAAGLATGNPSALYLCQEASGNLADSIGTFTLTASGTGLSYQQTVGGWARKAINTTEAATGAFINTDAGLPDISTTSALILGYIKPTTTGTTRALLGMGAAATPIAVERLLTSGFPRLRCGATLVSGVGGDPTTQVRPWTAQINRTATLATVTDELEKVTTATLSTATGKQATLGNLFVTDSTCSYLYAAIFFGAAAELSSAQLKTLLTTLGFAPAFS